MLREVALAVEAVDVVVSSGSVFGLPVGGFVFEVWVCGDGEFVSEGVGSGVAAEGADSLVSVEDVLAGFGEFAAGEGALVVGHGGSVSSRVRALGSRGTGTTSK